MNTENSKIISGEEMMTDRQKLLSEAREKWINALAKSSLSPKECFIEVVYIGDKNRRDGFRKMVSYHNSIEIGGKIRGKKIRMFGKYTGLLPYSSEEHKSLKWKPDAYDIDSVKFDGEDTEGIQAQEIAEKLLQLLAPHTEYAEMIAISEIKEHDKWIKGEGKRIKAAKREETANRLRIKAQTKALSDISSRLGNGIDLSGLIDNRGWIIYPFDNYDEDKIVFSEEEKRYLTEPQQEMCRDRETWLMHLDQKFGLSREKANLKFFSSFCSLGDDREKIDIYGYFQGNMAYKYYFRISGDIDGLNIYIEGSGYAHRDLAIRRYSDIVRPILEKVVIGKQTFREPESCKGIVKILGEIAEPDSSTLLDKHAKECLRHKQEQRNEKAAQKSIKKLNSLIG